MQTTATIRIKAATAPLLLVALLTLTLALSSCTPGLSGSGPSQGLVRRLGGHSFWVNSVSWSPDSKLLASGSSDATVRIWDVSTGNTVTRLTSFNGGVNTVAWSPDGKFLATASAEPTNSMRVWDTTNWKTVFTLSPQASVDGLAWSPNGKSLAVGLSADLRTKASWFFAVYIYDVSTWKNTSMLAYPYGGGSLVWSPDNKRITFGSSVSAGSLDSTLVVWDSSGGHGGQSTISETIQLTTIPGKIGGQVAWSGDNRYIAIAANGITAQPTDNVAEVWDRASKRIAGTVLGHTMDVNSVAWSPDSKYLATGSTDKTAKVWDVASQQNVATYTANDIINDVAWSPDGKYLAAASADWNVYIWDASNVNGAVTLPTQTGGP